MLDQVLQEAFDSLIPLGRHTAESAKVVHGRRRHPVAPTLVQLSEDEEGDEIVAPNPSAPPFPVGIRSLARQHRESEEQIDKPSLLCCLSLEIGNIGRPAPQGKDAARGGLSGDSSAALSSVQMERFESQQNRTWSSLAPRLRSRVGHVSQPA